MGVGICLLFAAWYYIKLKKDTFVFSDPNARTLYNGGVSINEVSLIDIKERLERQGCRNLSFVGEKTKPCLYRDTYMLDKGYIEVYPGGVGWGPLSFTITKNSVSAEKDIPGSPDIEKYKNEVRADILNTNIGLEIKENSWKLNKVTYPWSVVY